MGRARRSPIDRFGELGRYFLACGCCLQCAQRFANAALHQEMGRRAWVPPKSCLRANGEATRPCRELAVDGWENRPGVVRGL